jgi:hypothetical protein
MPKSAPIWIQTSKSPQASMLAAAHHAEILEVNENSPYLDGQAF